MLPDLTLGMKVKLRKPHPCGGYEWEIVRLGADIGLVCLMCGHKVLLSRRDLSKRLKTVLYTPAQDPTSNVVRNVGYNNNRDN